MKDPYKKDNCSSSLEFHKEETDPLIPIDEDATAAAMT